MKAEYIQTHDDKNIKSAEYWLRNNDYTHYVYFETPFMIYYLGCNNLQEATKKYQTIMKREKDMYGKVLSVKIL
jgi:hypothetical protein